MKVKVSELNGPALDWAVGVAIGLELKVPDGFNKPYWYMGGELYCSNFQPSTEWIQGGPLIERYDPEERRLPERDRYAEIWLDRSGGGAGVGRGVGETRLIAFCRALVNAKLGDGIEIPDELLATA
jgi:hypothetical protein